MRPGTILRYKALLPYLIKEMGNSIVVLDIGGYDGHISYYLKMLFPKTCIIVLDIDIKGLEIAKKKHLSAICSTATEACIMDNQVDVVLCLDVIEHVKEDEKIINEISRMLRVGGKIILSTPKQCGVSFPFLSRIKAEDINISWGHIRKGYEIDQLMELFRNNGLIIKNRGGYFNLLSRFFYRIIFLSQPFPKGTVSLKLFEIVTSLEPYIKYKTVEHIVVGEKI